MLTFHELAARYFSTHLNHVRSAATYRRLWDQYFDAIDWAPHPTRSQIRTWHRAFAHTPAWSNKGLSFLRALYNWAIAEELFIGENPATLVKKHQTYSRSTVLTMQEILALMGSLDFCHWKFRTVLIVLMTSGCRLSEALSMRWTDVDLVNGSWTKPRTKNGRPHHLPLPSQTVVALSALPHDGPFCFMGDGETHLTDSAAEKAWGRFRTLLQLRHVRLHDIRRTVATRLYEQGEPEILIKSILNHHDGNVTAIYIRPSFDRQAAALQRHADILWVFTKEASYDTRFAQPVPTPQSDFLCPAASA